jgi:hypothetical protein
VAIGDDGYFHIAERPVDPVGQPAASSGTTYINTSNTYDVAIGGIPFFLGTSEKYPYKRETAQYRKQQIDMQKEPGEQTLTGWWLRSQSSFHYGAGIRFEEPVQGEAVGYRFNKSAGVDVFNIGKTQLLPDVDVLKSSSGSNIGVEGGVDANGVDFALMVDGSNLYRIVESSPGTYTSTTLTWGGSGTILDISHDGVNYYVANATGIYRGPLTGATNGTSIFAHPSSVGTVTHVKMNWVKQRLIAGVNNYVFEVTPITSYVVKSASLTNNTATFKTDGTAHNFAVGSQITVASVGSPYNGTWSVIAVPDATRFSVYISNANISEAVVTGTAVLTSNNDTPVYAHPNIKWIWTGVCEGPNAIYVAGYQGDTSTVFRLSLDATGNVPLLNKALTAADMPRGEYITSLGSYVGKYMVFGTNKGVRVGTIDTSGFISSGYITYGPMTVVTNGYDPASGTILNGSPINYIAFQDRFAYCTVTNYIDNGDGTYSSGLVKIDLSREITPNQFAYATHLRVPNTNEVTDVAVFGHDNRLIMGVTGKGAYIQSATRLCTSGYIQTGQIRYLTLEDKHFKLVKVLAQNPFVSNLKLSTVLDDGTVTDVITIDQNFNLSQDIATNLSTERPSLALRFTIYPTDDLSTATIFNGYQLKALPAVHRTRMITLPLLNYDFEGDRYNMTTGYEGRAAERLLTLETLEGPGNVVTLQDFTNNETVQGVIETIAFQRMTPPERRFKGFGGIIYLTLRTI